MKRFLFVIVDGGGNVPAQISIARRLRARGHDCVLGDPAIEPEAARAGCSFHSFVHAPQHNMRDRHADVIRDWEPSLPILQVRRVGEHLMFGPAAAYARDVLEAVDRVQPDALAIDCLPFGAIIGAEKSGVPSAVLVHFPFHPLVRGVTPFGLGLRRARGPLGRLRDRVLIAAMRHVFTFGLTPVNAARRELGLEPCATSSNSSSGCLALLSLPRASSTSCRRGCHRRSVTSGRNSTIPGGSNRGTPHDSGRRASHSWSFRSARPISGRRRRLLRFSRRWVPGPCEDSPRMGRWTRHQRLPATSQPCNRRRMLRFCRSRRPSSATAATAR